MPKQPDNKTTERVQNTLHLMRQLTAGKEEAIADLLKTKEAETERYNAAIAELDSHLALLGHRVGKKRGRPVGSTNKPKE